MKVRSQISQKTLRKIEAMERVCSFMRHHAESWYRELLERLRCDLAVAPVGPGENPTRSPFHGAPLSGTAPAIVRETGGGHADGASTTTPSLGHAVQRDDSDFLESISSNLGVLRGLALGGFFPYGGPHADHRLRAWV